jgi:hypothetical protein
MKTSGRTSSRSARQTTSSSMPEFANSRSMNALDAPASGPDQPGSREPAHVGLLDQRGERVPADLQPVDDPLGLPVVRDGDREVDVPGEPGLPTERHCQAPMTAHLAPIASRSAAAWRRTSSTGCTRAYPRAGKTEPVARLATRPAQPRLDPGLDFLIRGKRVLPAHPLAVHPHPGITQVEDHPELRNVSSGHNAITPIVGSRPVGPPDTRPGTAGCSAVPRQDQKAGSRAPPQVTGEHCPPAPPRPFALVSGDTTDASNATACIDDQQTHR